MWRFWLYRTTDPDAPDDNSATKISWHNLGVDPMTNIELSGVSDDVTTVWRYHHHWIKTGQTPPPRPEVAQLSPEARAKAAEHLFAQLHTKEDAAEPIRIGAAYKLASIGDTQVATRLLGKALYTDRESVRRAATYGLIAVGEEATATLLAAAASEIK